MDLRALVECLCLGSYRRVAGYVPTLGSLMIIPNHRVSAAQWPIAAQSTLCAQQKPPVMYVLPSIKMSGAAHGSAVT